MDMYSQPKKAFLIQDLAAYDTEENDRQLVYFFEKGHVTVLGEFKSEEYAGSVACIIFNGVDVISVGKGMLRFMGTDEK